MAAMIEAVKVSKIYHNGRERIRALDGVSLRIEEGEFVSVLGVSGSGKSTLMNLIAGFDRPDKGEMTVGGRQIFALGEREMSRYRNELIGFVFQSFNLQPSLTALENVMMPLVYGRVNRSERRKRAETAIGKVGLSSRMDAFPHQLSGGQRQRVSIARAIVGAPAIILADEPTGNLDHKSGDKVMKVLGDLNGKGYTVIMVTHNREQAGRTGRVIELADGKLVSS